jgi:hypothetical protein
LSAHVDPATGKPKDPAEAQLVLNNTNLVNKLTTDQARLTRYIQEQKGGTAPAAAATGQPKPEPTSQTKMGEYDSQSKFAGFTMPQFTEYYKANPKDPEAQALAQKILDSHGAAKK